MAELWRVFVRAAKVEWRYLAAHRIDQLMLFWVPLGALLMIWWVFSAAQVYRLPIGVHDQDASALSRQLTRYLQASPGLSVTNQYHNKVEVAEALKAVDVYGVVEIPDDFSRSLKTGHAAPVSLQVNAQFGTHSGLIQRDVRAVVGTFSAGVEYRLRRKQGQGGEQAMASVYPIGRRLTTVFNTSTNYQQFLATAVMPALLHMLAMVAGAYAIGRELRDHSLLRWYRQVSGGRPVSKARIMVLIAALNGKLLFPMLLFSIWSALCLWLSAQNIPVDAETWLVTFTALWLMSLISFWMGVLASTGQLSLRMGLSSAALLSAPALAFSGVTFPLSAMSSRASQWAEWMPLTHYLRLQIAQMQMGAPTSSAISVLMGMSFTVLIMLLLSVLTTRRALHKPERWGAR